ncbi:MAG: hypothetical protein HQK67_05395, partial [Desulfamplus sp.]|nr:hypothetical protein [Desulfamplus sp.]
PSSISPSSISPSSISEYNNSKAVNHSTDDFHYGTEFKQILYSDKELALYTSDQANVAYTTTPLS